MRPSVHRPFISSKNRVRHLLGLALSATLLTFSAAAIVPVEGQDRGRRERARDEHEAPSGETEPDAPDGADDVDVDSSVRTEGGEKVKVMEFSGLDISGRLKSPQLLYFLNRLRAEFDRPRLPHRSFVGEMERSSHEESF